jgi:hypothetical protein
VNQFDEIIRRLERARPTWQVWWVHRVAGADVTAIPAATRWVFTETTAVLGGVR